jgi:exopolysaccharide biosynthesis protein
MTLAELRDLAARLGLRSALNLDGGGSTTMWVSGRVVNGPSDAAGPRKVSDALLVVPR